MAIFQDLNASVTPIRPVEQPSAIGAVSSLLKGSGFFDRTEPTKPTEGEAYETAWNKFLGEKERVLQPGDPGYSKWLRSTSVEFVANNPQFSGRVKSSLEAQGIAIPIDPETSQEDKRQALYTDWSSSPVGMVTEDNARRVATDKNGTFNPKIFESEMDKGFAKHITVQADLAQEADNVASASNRKTLGQTYWNKGRYFADEAIVGQVNVLADLVEDVRDGSAIITPEMSEVLGLPAGKVTTENFSTLLTKYRPTLVQSIIANTANTLASTGNVDVSVLEENPPTEEWIAAVMAPIDSVISAGGNFDSAAEVVKNLKDIDMLTAYANLTAEQRAVISVSELMPPELRSPIYELSADVNWKETSNRLALEFTAEKAPEVIVEDVSNMSSSEASDAALFAAGALDTGSVKGPTLRSSVLTLFAGNNRVDASRDLGIETFAALSKNSAGINQEAAMDPSFRSAVVDNVLSDVTKSFKKAENLLKGQPNLAYTVDDKGNISIVPDVAPDPLTGQVDFNTMQALEGVAEQLNNSETVLTFTRKLTELDKLGGVGAEIKDAFLTVNGLNMQAGETISVGGGSGRLGGGAGSDTLRGAGSGSTSSAQITYALPEAIAADTAFLDKVVSVSSELGFDPNDLLRVIDFETAGSFSPKAQPIRKDGTKISSATGLIQFLEKTANGLGTTTADLANMTAVEQLDYVKRYFEPFKGRIKNFGDVYMAVHWPKGVGKDDSYVMYEAGSDSYDANKGLDTNGDGTVTRGETLARLFSATGKGGNPTAGTPANANTVAAAAGPAVQRAVNNAPSPMAATTPAATAEVTPMEATAALPEAIPAEAAGGLQGASELSPAIALDQDVQAFIQEIAGDPDKTYASEAEFVAAQEAGELEAGDTVVVNGEIYVVRKNGSVRRLGTVNS
jgi:hypothetical protein